MSLWITAKGRFRDILRDLASVENVPLPSSVSSTNKRERDEEEPQSFPASASILSTTAIDSLILQPVRMPRNVVTPRRLSRDNSSIGIKASSATHAHPLQYPQVQQHAPPLQRSKSQSLRVQASQEHSQHIERPPPAHRLYSINAELDRQPLYQQSTFSIERQHMPPYSADAQYWYRPLVGDPADSDIQPVRLNTNPQLYAQTTLMDSFEMTGIVPSHAMPIEHSVAYAYSPGVDNPGYCASIHPHTSTNVAMDGVRQYPATLYQYPRHLRSQGQQPRNTLENGVWSGVPAGLGWVLVYAHINLYASNTSLGKWILHRTSRSLSLRIGADTQDLEILEKETIFPLFDYGTVSAMRFEKYGKKKFAAPCPNQRLPVTALL